MADPVPASREELLRYLETITGRAIRSRADLEAYLAELRANAGRAQPPVRAQRAWSVAKHATLAAGILIAGLQYYLMGIYVEISSMQRVQFLNPDLPALQHSALEVLQRLC